jgi:hypothetical protein
MNDFKGKRRGKIERDTVLVIAFQLRARYSMKKVKTLSLSYKKLK